MKFITAEQFLESDKKVQDAIIRWWKPSIGDLTESKVKGEVWCLIDDIQVARAEKTEATFAIPLLTKGQLIEFVENAMSGYIEYSKCNGFIRFTIYTPNSNASLATEFRINETDLLQALWKVVQRIIP